MKKSAFLLILLTFLVHVGLWQEPVFAGMGSDPDEELEVVTDPPYLLGQRKNERLFQNASAELSRTKTIMIDLRGSRGGKGDVAAGYLTALDLLSRYKYGGQVYLLMDDVSNGIINKLTGIEIRPGMTSHNNHLHYEMVKCLPKGTPPADLYLSLASPNGLNKNSGDFYRYVASSVSPDKGLIPIHKDTIRIYQTVLGNTENRFSKFSLSMVFFGNTPFLMASAGLAQNEAGIYYDHVALSLRGKSEEYVKQFIKTNSGHFRNKSVQKTIANLMDNRVLNRSKVGIAYGITASDVKGQFEGYLSALVSRSNKTGEAFTIVTPSGFSLSDVRSSEISSRVEVIDVTTDVAHIPKIAQPGKIYVLKTGSLSHRSFIGMLALSQIPPVVAGDGAMSAAIVLGKPYVMTQVAWNKANIRNFTEILQEGVDSDPEIKSLLKKYASSDLTVQTSVGRFRDNFSTALEKIPALSDSILAVAAEAREVVSKKMTLPEISSLPSKRLRVTKLIQAFHQNVQSSAETLGRELFSDAALFRTLLTEGAFSPEMMNNPLIFEAFQTSFLNASSVYDRKIAYESAVFFEKEKALQIYSQALDKEVAQETLMPIMNGLFIINNDEARNLLKKKLLVINEGYTGWKSFEFLLLNDMDFSRDPNQVIKNMREKAYTQVILNQLKSRIKDGEKISTEVRAVVDLLAFDPSEEISRVSKDILLELKVSRTDSHGSHCQKLLQKVMTDLVSP